MAKLFINPHHRPGLPDVYFNCPGCNRAHGVWTKDCEQNHCTWQFNGDMDKPTFSPSILTYAENNGARFYSCHSFIKDGMIQFLSDCTHALAGQTVELPEAEFNPENSLIL